MYGTHTLPENWNGSTWSIVSSEDPGSPGQNIFSGVAALSTKYVWAVGDYTDPNTNQFLTLIEHNTGNGFTVISSPNIGSGASPLSGVFALTASNVWAVGSYTNSKNNVKTLIEHWNGKRQHQCQSKSFLI